ARLPLSSRNPEIDKIVGSKPRIVVLNKSDMADSDTNKQWISWFKSKGISAVEVNSLNGQGITGIDRELEKVLSEKFRKDEERGIQRHAVKMMVAGIPNVGKSSFINKLSKRAATKTGNRPGVTQAKQWIRIAGKYELLDTPGILWPKFEDKDAAMRIAFTGGIKDEIMDIEELAFYLVDYLKKNYPENLQERYKLDDGFCEIESYELLELIGRKRGCIVSGGNVDMLRASNLILDDFRSAKIGNISLEKPSMYK
ncbi:MAG: ribosome biogenesis GTPase YlqF, partial [Clostridia bacterium]|nr:ribosome biogenesis GTPase YlqF [Clostridia bacterium]